MNELKPCPFCGGEAKVIRHSLGDGKSGFLVMCQQCGATGGGMVGVYDAYIPPRVNYLKWERTASIINTWNRRAKQC